MPIVSKPLPLRRAERKNGSRTHSADPSRTPASAPPPHRHSGNTQHENTETQKSAPLSGDRSATAPRKWKRTLIPLITRPVRVTRTSATLIDNIYSNQILDRDHSLSGIMLTDITDHYPIFHIASYVHAQDAEYSITRRNYITRNKDNFISQSSNIDWADVLQSDSTQKAFFLFHNKLKNLHDNCFPLQHISKKYNTGKPWLFDTLRDAIKEKNKLYRKSIKIKSVYNEMVYKNYRNKLRHLLKAAEKKYYSDLVLVNKSNSKRMWSIIKNMINRNQKKYIDK